MEIRGGKSSALQSLYEVYLVVDEYESMKEAKTNPVELYKCGWDHQWSYKDCVRFRKKRTWLLYCESVIRQKV